MRFLLSQHQAARDSAVGRLAEADALVGWGFGFELQVGLFLVGGVLLALVLLGLSRLTTLVPMRRERRESVGRAVPVVGLLLFLPYLLFALRAILRNTGQVQALTFLAFIGLGVISAWFVVRDLIAGVVLKAGRICSVGDRLVVGDLEGRVVRMGVRTLTLETSHGEEALVPYSSMSRSAVVRTPAVEGVAPHVFRVQTGGDVSVSDARRAVLEAALCAHWASVVRQPQIKALGEHTYEVTVFALNGDYAMDVEAAVLKTTGYQPVTGRRY